MQDSKRCSKHSSAWLTRLKRERRKGERRGRGRGGGERRKWDPSLGNPLKTGEKKREERGEKRKGSKKNSDS